MKDADLRFHEEWLGLAQPIEGLVFSVPALADAQIAPKIRPSLTAELEAHLEETEAGPTLRDLRTFFETFLGYSAPGALIDRDDLPPDLAFYAPEGRQEIRPTFAIARTPAPDDHDDPFALFEAELTASSHSPSTPASITPSGKAAAGFTPSPREGAGGWGHPREIIALVWDLTRETGAPIDLDKPETHTGPWRYPPTAKFERLLRHTQIPIGLLSSGRELRLLYAPAGESSAHLTFRFEDLRQRAGRPLLAALELLLHASRTYGAAPEYTFEGLLKESRLRQADVTKDLAAQVFEAVEILRKCSPGPVLRTGPDRARRATARSSAQASCQGMMVSPRLAALTASVR